MQPANSRHRAPNPKPPESVALPAGACRAMLPLHPGVSATTSAGRHRCWPAVPAAKSVRPPPTGRHRLAPAPGRHHAKPHAVNVAGWHIRAGLLCSRSSPDRWRHARNGRRPSPGLAPARPQNPSRPPQTCAGIGPACHASTTAPRWVAPQNRPPPHRHTRHSADRPVPWPGQNRLAPIAPRPLHRWVHWLPLPAAWPILWRWCRPPAGAVFPAPHCPPWVCAVLPRAHSACRPRPGT